MSVAQSRPMPLLVETQVPLASLRIHSGWTVFQPSKKNWSLHEQRESMSVRDW